MPDESNPSLKDEESKAPYNESKAREAFGNDSIDALKTQQEKFTGDWWQLALLKKNLEDDAKVTGIKSEDRLRAWTEWRGPDGGMTCPPPGEDYEWIHLEHVNLMDDRLEYAELTIAHLEHANLFRAHLVHASLHGARLKHATLQGAQLEHASLAFARLEHANLSGAYLKHANLWGACLEHAKLDTAHLEHANLWDAHLGEARLDSADLRSAYLARAYLERADLTHAILEDAYLIGANLRRTSLNDTNVRGARLIRVRGLFGRDRASVRDLREAEWAIYGYKFDRVPWSLLRSIGSLRLFGASYAAFTIITAYAALIHWYNEKLTVLHQWAAKTTGSDNSWLAGLIERLPSLPVPTHLGWQLLMIGFLAIGATLYAMFCPEAIKEATETRWTRELNQPVIEYRSAMYSGIFFRYVCAICYAVGGTYTLYYLAHRGYEAIRFLMGG